MCIRIEEGSEVGGGFESVTEFKTDCIFLFALICLYRTYGTWNNGYSTSSQTFMYD
jgi:hypothetical protein